ncbi:MAG: RecX family transcriptional regulator [Muribaculaceae bacterium]|nr:RecX family transcriptional regulator [Muribaculaceae bacterium]
MRKQARQVTPEEAIVRLETLCVKAERCRRELAQKLRQWRIEPERGEAILDSLQQRRFYDDARFARAFVRDRFRFSHWGRRKIVAELRARGIAADTLAAALEEIEPEAYEASARAIIRRRLEQTPDSDTYEGRTRVFRHAVSRGYEPDLVARILRSVASGRDADLP